MYPSQFFLFRMFLWECFNNTYKYDGITKREWEKERGIRRAFIKQGSHRANPTGLRRFVQQYSALSICAFRGRINSRRERALILPSVDYDGACFMKCFRDENIKLLQRGALSSYLLINNENSWEMLYHREKISFLFPRDDTLFIK